MLMVVYVVVFWRNKSFDFYFEAGITVSRYIVFKKLVVTEAVTGLGKGEIVVKLVRVMS